MKGGTTAMVHKPQPGMQGATSAAAAPSLHELLSRAVAWHQAGRLAEAEQLYRQILETHPRQFDCLNLLGVIHYQRGAYLEAVRQLDLALAINANVAAAHNSRAAALNGLGRFEEAIACSDRAIALNPDYAEAYCNRALALVELKRFSEALASCDRAIALRPDLADAFDNRGNALKGLDRLDEALASFERAIAIKPDMAEAFNDRANLLNQLKRPDAALDSAERALALRPNLAQAHYNRGIALHELKRFDEALASYDAALALRPGYAEALVNRGTVLLDLRRHDEARASYARALQLDPAHDYLAGMHLHAKMLVCDWTDFAADCAQLNAAVADGAAASLPFQLLACSSDPALQLACAHRYVADKFPASHAPLWRGEVYAHERIRVAYLSSDFGDHPVSMLAAGLFERHDRNRVETTAISFGPDRPGAMRTRIAGAFDRFIDARTLGDADVARLIRELEIDIAVDLNGLTEGLRPGILARRPAPVRVNYLGYAGTAGGPQWDYILADRFVIPEASRRHYAEQVVYLPDTFMVTDASRKISDRTPSRAEAGLPESGLVFCCFNNSYKITPDVFDVWMHLLRRVEGSVLWLAAVNASAVDNLRREAQSRGVAADRVVFAPKVALNEDHLARIRLADLFLDTLNYNAHATAADALWAGVPVLACAGATFASRVAGSLLHAVGLPELATASIDDYAALALRLAGDPARVTSLRHKLARNRTTFPLFDTDRFARHLEAAYATMRERTRRGEPPQSFAVAPFA
jgi:predicted O-linked N-acetylglucosamine transferase (SPINDLY family)